MEIVDDLCPSSNRFKVPDEGYCVYCGEVSQCYDHVIPRSKVGEKTLKVPSCNECNFLASDNLFNTLPEKRNYIRKRLRQKYRKLVKMPYWSEEELSELSGDMRKQIEGDIKKSENIKKRLKFKIDEGVYSEKGICKKCKKTFAKSRSWQKFCSNLCRSQRQALK